MVSAGPAWVAAVVSGQDQNVIFTHQLHQLRQTAVEQFQARSITGDIATMSPGRVEINEVGEDDGLITGFFHLFDGGVEQRVQTGGFHFFGDAAVSVDIRDFTDGNHVTVFFVDQFLQHGRCWRLNGQVVAVTGTLEVTGFITDKRTGDNTTDVVTTFGQLFTGDFAQLIELIQAKSLFVAGNLEHGVSGGIENRLAGFHMLFTQLIQDHGTGRVAVAEVARQVGTFYQFIQQFLREAVFMIGEISPVKQNRNTRDFPVARRRVFPGRKFMRPCVGTNHFRVAVHASSNFTSRTFVSFHQAQTGQVRQIQWTFATIVSFTFRTGFCNVSHSV